MYKRQLLYSFRWVFVLGVTCIPAVDGLALSVFPFHAYLAFCRHSSGEYGRAVGTGEDGTVAVAVCTYLDIGGTGILF